MKVSMSALSSAPDDGKWNGFLYDCHRLKCTCLSGMRLFQEYVKVYTMLQGVIISLGLLILRSKYDIDVRLELVCKLQARRKFGQLATWPKALMETSSCLSPNPQIFLLLALSLMLLRFYHLSPLPRERGFPFKHLKLPKYELRYTSHSTWRNDLLVVGSPCPCGHLPCTCLQAHIIWDVSLSHPLALIS